MNSKAVLLFGSFNPITNAHIAMGIRAKQVYPDADIIYIPAPCQYIKDWKKYNDADVLSDIQRLHLIRNSIDRYKDFYVNDIEIRHFDETKEVLTTFRTMRALRLDYNYEKYIVCLGADKIEELHTWEKGFELVIENDFLIIERNYSKGVLPDILKPYAENFIYAGGDYPNVSSTQIRAAIQEKRIDDVKSFIPPFVYEFFKERENKEMGFNAKKTVDDCVAWIKDWFEHNGKGCNAVVGISGGKDSSVVAALCVKALGKDRVIGVLMPNGVQSDINDSLDLCKFLDIKYVTIPIGQTVNVLEYEIVNAVGGDKSLLSEQTRINMPARVRMVTLYAVSQSMNGRVANTCNKSEDWVGYATKYGDAAGDFSPLSNLLVTEVKAMGYELGLPTHLIEKTPADGLCGKSDEDNLGFTYSVLDEYIKNNIQPPEEIKDRIDKLHKQNLFKLLPMASFSPTSAD